MVPRYLAYVMLSVLLPGFSSAGFSAPSQSSGKSFHPEKSSEPSPYEEAINLQVEACRTKLDDLERLRKKARTTGITDEVFEDLTSRAREILTQMEHYKDRPDFLFLLGECRGILDTLLLTFERTKPRRKIDVGHGPRRTQSSSLKPVSVARPNSYRHEPLPKKPNAEEEEREGDFPLDPYEDELNQQQSPHLSNHTSRKSSSHNPYESVTDER